MNNQPPMITGSGNTSLAGRFAGLSKKRKAAILVLVLLFLSLIVLIVFSLFNQQPVAEDTRGPSANQGNGPISGDPLQPGDDNGNDEEQENGTQPNQGGQPGQSGPNNNTNQESSGDTPPAPGTPDNGGGSDTPGGGEETPSHPPGTCPPFPAFPDDNCTGWQHTGVTLQTCIEGDGDEGDGHLEKPNVTYDGCDFANGAVVHSENVTIKRSRIQGIVNGHWTNDYDLRNLILEDVEIIAATPQQIQEKTMTSNGGSATNGPNFTCIRCRIHYVPTGISLGDNNIIIDSYISDVTWGPGAHQAAIGAGQDNGHNSQIIHNNIQCNRWNVNAPGFEQGCSSALSLYDEPTLNNVLVKNNLFNTTGGYCTYGGGPQGTNIRYIDNRFGKLFNPSCGIFGTVSAFHIGNAGNVWQGNTWLDGSGSVSP